MEDSQETVQKFDRFVQSCGGHLGTDILVAETELEEGCKAGSNFNFFPPNISTNYVKKIQSCRSNVNDDSGDDSHLRKRLKSFVASKADLIFKLKGKEKWRSGIDYKADSSLEAYKCFATQIPALETEMQISATVRRTHMFQILKVGDIIIGNVVAKRPFGVFARIVSLRHGRNLDFNEIDIQVLCHKSELDHKSREHLDPVDDFEINDIVQGVICSVSVEEEKIAISFRSSKLPSEYGNIELGIIEDGDEHIHRMQFFGEDKDYNDYLHKDSGFANPTNVQTLINVLGINTNPPCSLLTSCQRWSFDGQKDASSLRKNQSMKWSMDTTAIGVENFKCGSHEKAMKYFNHALQIYGENAEALVARGALYANKNKLDNAIKDFREALKVHPKHHNACKYLKETLVEKAVRIKKIGIIKEAIDIFQEILSLDPHHIESQDHLRELQSLMSLKCEEERRKERKASEGSAKESYQFEHVRKLIKADPDIARTSHKKRRKKKRKDIRHKKWQRRVSDESTSTASEGEDYGEGDDNWVEKKVEKKLGAKSPEENKEQGEKDHGQRPEDREEVGDRESVTSYSVAKDKSNREKVKEERKGHNETRTRSDLKQNLSQESHGSQRSHCKSTRRHIQSGTQSKSGRRSQGNSRSTSRDRRASRSTSRDRRASRSTKGSRRASRSTRSTKGSQRASRSTSRDRDRRAYRSASGSRSTSGSGRSTSGRSTSGSRRSRGN